MYTAVEDTVWMAVSTSLTQL